jgi:hypothetical protein
MVVFVAYERGLLAGERRARRRPDVLGRESTMAGFDVSGRWDAQQSNGHVASFDIQPRGNQGVFHGTASHSGGKVRGHGEGVIRGNDFLFTVTWNNGTVGEYNGRFNEVGRITGVTFNVSNRQHSATWVSSKSFRRL